MPVTYNLGDGYTLELEYIGKESVSSLSKNRYRYDLARHDRSIFRGADFCSPSFMSYKESAVSLLGFLCLQEGDTDSEYFDSYTPSQIEWRDTQAAYCACIFAIRLGVDCL